MKLNCTKSKFWSYFILDSKNNIYDRSPLFRTKDICGIEAKNEITDIWNCKQKQMTYTIFNPLIYSKKEGK